MYFHFAYTRNLMKFFNKLLTYIIEEKIKKTTYE